MILRSLRPDLRDAADNIVLACADCNEGRSRGVRPGWDTLPERVQRFVLREAGPSYAERYFRGFTDPE